MEETEIYDQTAKIFESLADEERRGILERLGTEEFEQEYNDMSRAEEKKVKRRIRTLENHGLALRSDKYGSYYSKAERTPVGEKIERAFRGLDYDTEEMNEYVQRYVSDALSDTPFLADVDVEIEEPQIFNALSRPSTVQVMGAIDTDQNYQRAQVVDITGLSEHTVTNVFNDLSDGHVVERSNDDVVFTFLGEPVKNAVNHTNILVYASNRIAEIDAERGGNGGAYAKIVNWYDTLTEELEALPETSSTIYRKDSEMPSRSYGHIVSFLEQIDLATRRTTSDTFHADLDTYRDIGDVINWYDANITDRPVKNG